MSEQRKLEEARYFLDQMRQWEHLVPDWFEFNLSAFLAASRSVMQYLEKKAANQGRQRWYQTLTTASPWDRRFKQIRDPHIHEKPYKPRRFPFRNVPVGAVIDIDKATKYWERRKELAEECDPADADEIAIENQHTISMNGRRRNLVECCEAYLEELGLNIEKARLDGIL